VNVSHYRTKLTKVTNQNRTKRELILYDVNWTQNKPKSAPWAEPVTTNIGFVGFLSFAAYCASLIPTQSVAKCICCAIDATQATDAVTAISETSNCVSVNNGQKFLV
jgi:hypothetical protein